MYEMLCGSSSTESAYIVSQAILGGVLGEEFKTTFLDNVPGWLAWLNSADQFANQLHVRYVHVWLRNASC